MAGGNPWLLHVKKVWAVQKKKGKSYKQTLRIAAQSYNKKKAKK